MTKFTHNFDCQIHQEYKDEIYDCISCYNERIRAEERERIIKLLEVLWQKTQGTDIPAVVVLPEAIALIKGENE